MNDDYSLVHRLCVYASGSVMTVICKFFALINVSCLHFGQYIFIQTAVPLPSYFDFCFFKSMPHTITAIKKTRIRYHKFSKQTPLSSINRYPQKAGKKRPIISRKTGNKSMGNIIPESIIEGRNTNCAIIVNLA